LAIELQKKIQSGVIGHMRRSIVEIGLVLDWDALPDSHRIKDPALGAGALLDIGIYPLTYSSLIMGGGKLGVDHPVPAVTSCMTINKGVDESDVIVLQYNTGTNTESTAIVMATMHHANPQEFGRIEGTKGSITLYTELGPSCPTGFRVTDSAGKVEDFKFEHPAGIVGFIYEADAVAQDIAAGKTENAIMPLDETMRVMKLMDEIRRQNGLVYPADNA
jgi:dihydrodiol dehydrogenase / D-xylose 1-dehydrogenase (NADP)